MEYGKIIIELNDIKTRINYAKINELELLFKRVNTIIDGINGIDFSWQKQCLNYGVEKFIGDSRKETSKKHQLNELNRAKSELLNCIDGIKSKLTT